MIDCTCDHVNIITLISGQKYMERWNKTEKNKSLKNNSLKDHDIHATVSRIVRDLEALCKEIYALFSWPART